MTSVSKKLLVVLAHPDDETVMAGTIARYSSEGMRITLICTTNGGGGTAPEGVSHEDLCQTRKRELRAACEVLGVSRLELFEDRHAFPYHLDRKNYHSVVDQHRMWLGEILEEERPDVVVTFGPEGITGHQSHIMVGNLTTDAVCQCSFSPTLYYMALSPMQIKAMASWFVQNESILDAYADEVKKKPNLGSPTPLLYSVPDSDISVRIDISKFLAIKRAAIRCHATQGGGGGILDVFSVIDIECFVKALPNAASSVTTGSDLFVRAGAATL